MADYLSPSETAAALDAHLEAAGVTRARISNQTIEDLANRPRLPAWYIVALQRELADCGWGLHQLPTGGFGIIWLESLGGAKAFTIKKG